MRRIKKSKGYITNFDEYDDVGTYWMSIFNNAYMESFGIYSPEEILKFMKNDDINVDIFQIQDIKSIMCRYYYVLFI